MSNLRGLRTRRKSVLSTKKITSAMKLVAASKLRRVQDRTLNGRSYARKIEKFLVSVVLNETGLYPLPDLLEYKGKLSSCVLVVVTANRGLCGSLNSSVIREARKYINNKKQEGVSVKILCLGKKGYEGLRQENSSRMIMGSLSLPENPKYSDASKISRDLIEMFQSRILDHCFIIYNKFVSIISQKVITSQIIPFRQQFNDSPNSIGKKDLLLSPYDYEPSKKEVLEELLERNLAIQIYQIMLESSASEHGARMTSMDSATRNAEKMIKSLELSYNRERQSSITKELIELISSAEVVEMKH